MVIKRSELAIENVPPDEGRFVKFLWAPLDDQNHSLSKHGLETPLNSLFYLFVRVYAVLCTVHGQ
jgi:hypothetical protein